MKSFLTRRVALGAACAVVALVPVAASAQSDPFPDFFRVEPQTYADLPGVPDANGCVKLCFRDDSPCDPPSYKRADDRCGSINRRH